MKRLHLSLSLLLGLFASAGQLLPATAEFDTLATYIQKGQVIKLKKAVNKSNVNVVGDHGESLLHRVVAAKLFRVSMAKLLMSRGANVNAQTPDGIAPLHLAVVQGRAVLVKVLLANGADAKLKAKGGVTPLHMATAFAFFKGIKNIIPKLKSALSFGPNSSKGVGSNEVKAHLIAVSGIALGASSSIVGSIFLISYLVVTVGAAPAVLIISVGLAYAAGAIAVVEIGVRNSIAKMLIDHHADPNAQDENGNTPLHNLAAGKLFKLSDRRGGLSMAEYLMFRGADATIKNRDGKMPYNLAKESKRLLLMSLLSPKRAERRAKRKEWLGEQRTKLREKFAN